MSQNPGSNPRAQTVTHTACAVYQMKHIAAIILAIVVIIKAAMRAMAVVFNRKPNEPR